MAGRHPDASLGGIHLLCLDEPFMVCLRKPLVGFLMADSQASLPAKDEAVLIVPGSSRVYSRFSGKGMRHEVYVIGWVANGTCLRQ